MEYAGTVLEKNAFRLDFCQLLGGACYGFRSPSWFCDGKGAYFTSENSGKGGLLVVTSALGEIPAEICP